MSSLRVPKPLHWQFAYVSLKGETICHTAGGSWCMNAIMCQTGINGTKGSQWSDARRRKNIDHNQVSVRKLVIQHDHKVNCLMRICVKETFLLENYSEIMVHIIENIN